MNIEMLTALFRKLGAPDPEGWARSQVDEGIDQLARYVFLREAWKRVVPPEPANWIYEQIASAKARPADPGAGPGLQRLLAVGAARTDIHEVVRVMQWELLFSLCYLLEDPGELEPEIADMSWRLMRTDDDGECIGAIGGLHESVLEIVPPDARCVPSSIDRGRPLRACAVFLTYTLITSFARRSIADSTRTRSRFPMFSSIRAAPCLLPNWGSSNLRPCAPAGSFSC